MSSKIYAEYFFREFLNAGSERIPEYLNFVPERSLFHEYEIVAPFNMITGGVTSSVMIKGMMNEIKHSPNPIHSPWNF